MGQATAARRIAEMQTPASDTRAARRAGWIAILAVVTIVSSLVFACASPFAALATVAALHMNRRDAFVVTGITWAANQAVGYGLLHYPQTWDSVCWGVAIFAGAIVATAVAAAVGATLRSFGRALTVLAAFAAAFAAYEVTLFAATAVLPSDAGAFGLLVVLYILKVNALALAGLLVLQFAGARIGLASGRSTGIAPTAA